MNTSSAAVMPPHRYSSPRSPWSYTLRRVERALFFMDYFSFLFFTQTFSTTLMSMMNKNSTSAMEYSA